jgi:hypothetical protein
MHVVIRIGQLEGFDGFTYQLSTEGIQLLRAIKGDLEHVVLHLIAYGMKGHRGSPFEVASLYWMAVDNNDRENAPHIS